MQTIVAGYRGLSLLMDLNWDRVIYIATLVFALTFGGWVGSMLVAL